jgi:small subunit ribosomal protein S3
MGQKIHPTGYRLAVIEPWKSRWFAGKKNFGEMLLQDHSIRELIRKEFKGAGIPRVEIERSGGSISVIIHTARPGVLVGRKGVRVEQLKKDLQESTGVIVHLTVREIKRAELESTLVAEGISEALEKRMAFRRAIKKAIQSTMQAGALGIKIECNGRLNGGDMARTAKEREGRVPLSTLRSHVDYGTALAHTTYGIIGVKVWIYKGDIEPGKKIDYKKPMAGNPAPRNQGRGRGGPRRNDRDR